jgi:hypothetical protein
VLAAASRGGHGGNSCRAAAADAGDRTAVTPRNVGFISSLLVGLLSVLHSSVGLRIVLESPSTLEID